MTQSLRVLLVDDEPETLRLVRKILQSDGHTVIEAVDGQEALDFFRQERPDLILLDIIIPQIDGIEVLKRIRREDTVTGIIMVSALTSEKLAVEAMVNGADDYVSKPFPLKEIRVRINQAAAKARLRRENQQLQRQLAAAEGRVSSGPAALADVPADGLRDVSVMAADVGDVVAAVQTMPGERQLAVLRRCVQAITAAAHQHGALLHNVGANRVMTVFTNGDLRHSSEAAMRAALALRAAGQDVAAHGESPAMRVGIHSGTALIAHVGTPPDTTFTAVGDAVRLACQLSDIADPGDILLSHDSYTHLQGQVNALRADELAARAGLGSTMPIYRLTGFAAM